MSILLLAADGQVGFELHRALAPLASIVATTRKGVLPGGVACSHCDLGDHDQMRALIDTTMPPPSPRSIVPRMNPISRSASTAAHSA